MAKRIFLYLLAVILLGVPQVVYAQAEKESIESDVVTPSIAVNGVNLTISNANGSTLELYNLAGVKISSYRIDCAEKVITLSVQKGYYIVKLGKIVRKISIR